MADKTLTEDDVQDTVTISGEYFRQLLNDSKELNALHAGGVDNWNYYYDALIAAGLIEDD